MVQDCFQLLAALLRGSAPNQLMFRETGFLAQLPTMLRPLAEGGGRDGGAAEPPAVAGDAGSREMPPDRAANLLAALEVVLALLPPAGTAPGPTSSSSGCQVENRAALLQRGLLDVLLGLALQGGGVPDDAVRAQVRCTVL